MDGLPKQGSIKQGHACCRQAETQDMEWVCYCFEISKKMILKEIENTGQSASGNRIRQEIADGNCDCERLNPSGKCCLGAVISAEKEGQHLKQKNQT